jgi:antitoxin component of MazEF toxin-antitoxin module
VVVNVNGFRGHGMFELKVIKVEGSLGVCLPPEVISRLHLQDGDRVLLAEAPEGGYRLTPDEASFERQMEIAEEGMRRYPNTLKALAE